MYDIAMQVEVNVFTKTGENSFHAERHATESSSSKHIYEAVELLLTVAEEVKREEDAYLNANRLQNQKGAFLPLEKAANGIDLLILAADYLEQQETQEKRS